MVICGAVQEQIEQMHRKWIFAVGDTIYWPKKPSVPIFVSFHVHKSHVTNI